MKNSYTLTGNCRSIFLTILASVLSLNISFAQSSIDDRIDSKLKERQIDGAQLGSLICTDASGKLILCTGALDEYVSGIATNVPYVTLNKPSSPEGNRFIFMALISTSNGAVAAGDYLMANQGGTLAKCPSDQREKAYAVSLENVTENGAFRVKLLNR